jgi:hypothetical protein
VSIVFAALAPFDQRGDLETLFAHALRLKIRGHSCNTRPARMSNRYLAALQLFKTILTTPPPFFTLPACRNQL